MRLRLLSGFEFARDGSPVTVQPRGQRLLALLALHHGPVARAHAASALWPDASEDQALANLRSTLWRLHRSDRRLVSGRRQHLQLGEGIGIDVHEMVAQARRLIDAGSALEAGDDDPAPLGQQLLPQWWEDWVVAEREWLRQLQLHALECLAERLLAAGRFAQALEAALAAVAAEPLRESAQRVVIGIHLEEGNKSEALRQYASYRKLLHDELGMLPSHRMQRLLTDERDERRLPGVPAAAR